MSMTPDGLRSAAGRARQAVRRRRQALATPALTVVIPVYNVESYLPECLDSVLGQTLGELEVIAVDDGSTDGCPAILRDYARRDPRLRVLSQVNAGQGPARNLAVAHARGEFLTFCDSDDTVPPRAYAHMLRVLRETGSDFVVGAARRVRHGRNLGIAFRDVHLSDRLRTSIADSPDAMQDIIACNRMYRTRFWREKVPPFLGRIAYEDHVPGLAAYVRAERFDIISQVTYDWRVREDNTSTGQQKAVLQNLLDRVAVKEQANELLLAEAVPDAVYAAWLTRCLGVDFPPFLAPAAHADDTYRNVLSATLRTFFDRAGDEAVIAVPHFHKVRDWLCAEGRWEDLARAEEHFGTHGKLPATEVRDGRVFAVRDESAAFQRGLPETLWELGRAETSLLAAVRSVDRPASDTLRITGYAAIRAVDCSVTVPQVEAWLRDPASGDEVPLAVHQFRDPWANMWTQHRNAGYDNSAFHATVDPGELVRAGSGTSTWVLHVRVSQEGVVREGTVHAAVEWSRAHHLVPHEYGELRVTPALSGDLGFHLDVEAGPAIVQTKAHPDPTGAELTGAELTAAGIVLAVAHRGTRSHDVVRARLGNDRVTLDLVSVDAGPEETSRLTFATHGPAHDGSARVVPCGDYHLEIPSGSKTGARVTASGALLDRLPCSVMDDELRLTLLVRRSGDLVVRLEPPLTDEDRTVFGQARLQRSYAAGALLSEELRDADAVFFQCGYGEAAGDSQLALDRHLAATRPGMLRHWGVESRATAVPDGAIPVLVGSPEWYTVLASVRYLCTNDDFEAFFTRQPHQRYLRTFGAHPDEAIGPGWWAKVGDDRTPIDVDRRNDIWSSVVVPSDISAQLVREQLGYRGEVLALGSPRTDFLVIADREQVRTRTLQRLGVPPGRTVVLHATTTDGGLDPGALARALGEQYVVLSHEQAAGHELNELILTADVAVLDRSDLRFDWALTGRPVLFFVPDLDTAAASRLALQRFRDSAPGPVLRTADEVIQNLRNLDKVADEFGSALARINATYNSRNDGHATERVVKQFFVD